MLQIVDADGEGYGAKAMKGLLEQSKLCLGSNHSRQQVLHHFRFSIEYLLRQNLINSSGENIALSGLIMHLYYTEPANFALAELLRMGVFHRICRNFDPENPDPNVLESILHVLAHLFMRRIRKRADQEEIENVIKRSPSKVLLEPLPKDAQIILESHNETVMEIYRSYAIKYADSYTKTRKIELPLSGISFDTKRDPESMIVKALKDTAIDYVARSPFVATSGHGDSFDRIEDLADNIRTDILIERSAVPSMDNFIHPRLLDAYLLDFFKHGQIEALITGNGIHQGDVWFLLDGFNHILASIDESLKLVSSGANVDFAGAEMLAYDAATEIEPMWEEECKKAEIYLDEIDSNDRVVCAAFSILRSQFEDKFKKIWA
jgi:ATP-dependent RNA helicase DDX60